MENQEQPKLDQEKELILEEFIINEGTYKTTINKKYSNRKPYEAPNAKKIRSFMPGTIRGVFCEPGQDVEPETKLCILEAMKMKNVILPPFKGKIKEVFVKSGQLVPKNHVLIELE